MGDSNTVADQELQTVRGWARWSISENLYLRIANKGTGPVAHVSENDPVQNIPCAGCRIGEISDEPQIEFGIKAGGHTFGVYASNEAPTGISTDTDGGSQDTGGSNALSTGVFANLKFGDVNLLGFFITSSADNDTDGDGQFDDFAGSADAFMIAVKLKAGPVGINADIESGTSELDPNDPANADAVSGVPVAEEEVDHVGVKISVAGLVAAVGLGTQTKGSVEDEQQVVAVHYRIPVGKGAWVGPEFQQLTESTTDPSQTPPPPDVTTTTIRWLMATKF